MIAIVISIVLAIATVVLAAMAGAQNFKCDYTTQMRETKRCDLAVSLSVRP